MRDVIIIHGIGDHTPDYGDKLYQFLDYPQDKVFTLYYEDLLEASYWNKVLKWAAFAGTKAYGIPTAGMDQKVLDYLNDIQVYRGVKSIKWYRTRKKVMERAYKLFARCPNAIVIGHSLGSYVAYDTFQWYAQQLSGSNYDLITVGSPLGGKIGKVWEFSGLWLPDDKTILPRNVGQWVNIHSKLDKISGEIDEKFGVDSQIKVRTRLPNPHALEQYLVHASSVVHDLNQ